MIKFKQFIVGIIIAAMLFSFSAVFAENKSIVAYFNDIKIQLDGKFIELKDVNENPVRPFIHEGTTYLPVRAIAEALGMEVKYNETTNTVELTKKKVDNVQWEDSSAISAAEEKKKEEERLASLVDIYDRGIESWSFVEESPIEVLVYKDGRKFVMPYQVYSITKNALSYMVDKESKKLTFKCKSYIDPITDIPVISIDRGGIEYVIPYDEYKNNLLPKLLEIDKILPPNPM